MLASRITFAQRRDSLSTTAANSAGVPPVISKPSVWKRSLTAGSASTLFISAFTRWTTAGGMFAGPKMPK